MGVLESKFGSTRSFCIECTIPSSAFVCGADGEDRIINGTLTGSDLLGASLELQGESLPSGGEEIPLGLRSRSRIPPSLSDQITVRSRSPMPPSPSVQIFQGVFFMSQRFVVVEYVPEDVENASSLHEHQCNICMDKPKDLTLLPCKHSLCRECWNNITHHQGPKCPECRRWISTIRTLSPSICPNIGGLYFSLNSNQHQCPSRFAPSRTRSRRPQCSETNDVDTSDSETSASAAEEIVFIREKRTSDINLRRLSKWFVNNNRLSQRRGA